MADPLQEYGQPQNDDAPLCLALEGITDGLPTAKGVVAKTKITFLFDSGASLSSIPSSLLQKVLPGYSKYIQREDISLFPLESEKLKITARITLRFKLAGRKFHHFIRILPDTGVTASYCLTPLAILGWDFLQSYGVVLDPRCRPRAPFGALVFY